MGNISDLETQLGKIESEVYDSIKECSQISQLENVFQQYLGKKGALSILLKGLSSLEATEKKTWGQKLNQVRQAISEAHDLKKNALEKEAIEQKLKSEYYDFLQPLNVHTGHLHPVTKMQMEVESIFSSMGFEIMDGPEVETDENNFGRLNFSADHPAREMQDTIWTKDGNLLRTHTSCVQVRSMQKLKPPFRIIAPGRVFRYEQTDASHENTFHQVEGMMVGKDISVANLIGIMKSFLSAIFETDIKVRLRPGYFPFVEPGFELDSSCLICNAKGCKACKFSGWIELLPCGLIHPEVLKAGGMDPAIWNGFAFGLGLDRLVMLRYNIEDIRHFLSGNLRFLNQF